MRRRAALRGVVGVDDRFGGVVREGRREEMEVRGRGWRGTKWLAGAREVELRKMR